MNIVSSIVSFFSIKKGYKITNSTSKTKKINEIIKNWSEKVWRLFSQGENPHSNGLSLFLSEKAFKLKIVMRKTIKIARKQDVHTIILKIIISHKKKQTEYCSKGV